MTPSYPSGWFALATTEDLLPGRVLTRRLAGSEYVLFRDDGGRPAALGAHCPHLGAHMGHNGCLKEGTIVCPFHGFRFDRHGACVATGYGTKPPPNARVLSLPTHESGGWIFVYWHPGAPVPAWTPPTLDTAGWTPLQSRVATLRTHPQETTENSVDAGHFAIVHGYQDFKQHAFAVDGPYLHTRYSFTRPRGVPGWGRTFRVEIDVHVWGLGFSYVDATFPGIGLVARHFVLPTAVDERSTELRLGMVMKRTAAATPPLSWLPDLAFDHLAAPLAMSQYFADVMQDREIWENKVYVERPPLADGDGPIGRYRSWCRQFYPSLVRTRTLDLDATG